MPRQDDVGVQLGGASDRRVNVVDLEPQEHAVAVGPVIRVADRPVVVCDLEAVQLEDQHAVRDQALVLAAAVRALTAEEALVPPTAHFDIGHRDKGLGTHENLRSPNFFLATAAAWYHSTVKRPCAHSRVFAKLAIKAQSRLLLTTITKNLSIFI